MSHYDSSERHCGTVVGSGAGSRLSDSGSFGDEEIVSSKSARMSNPAMTAPITTPSHMHSWGQSIAAISRLQLVRRTTRLKSRRL